MSALHNGLTLLDGGMGQELVRRRPGAPTGFWSGQVLLDAPDLVRDVHADFIRAGAEVITVNSYTLTPRRLERFGIEDSLEDLQGRAVALARDAREIVGRPVRIAGCLPPLVNSYLIHDIPDDAECRRSYDQVVAAQAAGVDLFICETMSAIREARAATESAAGAGLPVWTALTVDDRDGLRLRSGEPLDEAVPAVVESGASAVLINCSTPEATSHGLDVLANSGRPFGAYANGFKSIDALVGGTTVDVLERREELTPAAYADFAESWAAKGATIIGGCCEVGPAHIHHLTERFRRAA
ncbi:MAG: homocysteine S-methyltransferase family protein [Alphaproteobacteria bacterium]|nr:homocysteine S-methyltransferase family protein [Alphaproteobacteria bacterium]